MTSRPAQGAATARPVLFVDASLQGVQTALIDAARGHVLWQGAHGENKGALEQVSRLVADGLAATGLTTKDLVGLAVGVGPGSFTGIKVGLAFVYGLRSGLSPTLPLLGVSSLEAAARALAKRTGTSVLVALPATKTHGFMSRAPAAGSEPAQLIDAEAASPLGPPAAASRVYIAASWPLLAAAAVAGGFHQESLTVEQLAATALPELVQDITTAWPDGYLQDLPQPRYLRLSTAEERLLAAPPAVSPQLKDLT